jgi:ubiquinone/menaquinone biosynthesis C-methylase UbiE
MSAAYDGYDYPSYWTDREYEHRSEILTIKSFLKKIPKLNNFLEIGSGYGRLLDSYVYRVKKVTLSDPSAKLLSLARKNNTHNKKVNFVHSKIENLKGKIHPKTQDAILMVRVLHHIENVDNTFKIINRLLIDKGYFILEFANKKHFKATFSEFTKGNFTFPLDIFPKDLRSKINIQKNTLPFINYHPDIIFKKLNENGFEILEVRSVSNFRQSFLKDLFPIETLILFETYLQKFLAKLHFGPSLFVLARKA